MKIIKEGKIPVHVYSFEITFKCYNCETEFACKKDNLNECQKQINDAYLAHCPLCDFACYTME